MQKQKYKIYWQIWRERKKSGEREKNQTREKATSNFSQLIAELENKH